MLYSGIGMDRDNSDRMVTKRKKTLIDFGNAWDQADVESLMLFITDDCVYSASVGPEPGKTYVGREEVKRGFTEMLAHDAGGVSRTGDMFMAGDKAVVEWAYIFEDSAGRQTELKGVDIFTFSGDKICYKDAYRKTS